MTKTRAEVQKKIDTLNNYVKLYQYRERSRGYFLSRILTLYIAALEGFNKENTPEKILSRIKVFFPEEYTEIKNIIDVDRDVPIHKNRKY